MIAKHTDIIIEIDIISVWDNKHIGMHAIDIYDTKPNKKYLIHFPTIDIFVCIVLIIFNLENN